MKPVGDTAAGDELFSGETVLRRVVQESGESVLTLTPAVDEPAPALESRLAQELSIGARLDSSWAVTPRALSTERRPHRLELDDPGGAPLEGILNGPLPPERFLELALAITESVRRMHESGIVHRDLKPANVLIDDTTRRAYLTGFGYAASPTGGHKSPPVLDVIVGTFAYMAPEQTGRMNRSVDSRSDLYSLGVVFYRMLTGELPFTASEPLEWVYAHIARQPTAPSSRVEGVPAVLSGIVLKLLAKNAEERYQTAAGVESDLRRCREQWEASGDVAPFPLGADDTPARLLVPERLYGRERECRELTDALDRVVSTGTPELFMVSGYSGVGKSALVHELTRQTSARKAIFVSGKYDQYRRDIPFSTVGQAFGSLVRRVLRQGEAEIEQWRVAVTEAVGRNGRVLIDLIPELEWLIGAQAPVLELGPMEARNRFQTVFRQFVRAIATAEHPLVLLVDDLQWIDPASLALLQYMATQRDVRHVLLVGVYRDNEVGPTHRLVLALEKMRKAKTIVNEMTLGPLLPGDVLRLVADTTRSDESKAARLAELVHAKTAGNPFFVIQFLESLADEKLLTFDPGARAWVADVDRIATLGITDNVVDLMVAKLRRLDPAALEIVERLACLGRDAPLGMLAAIAGRSEEEVVEQLDDVVAAGLVTFVDEVYRFVHDRVQEAAYSLIPPDSLDARHLEIGRVLLARSPDETPDETLFEVVDHLNRGVDLVDDPVERRRLGDLDLAAGRRAKSSIAYTAARSYLEQARQLLEASAWSERYATTLALHLELLECEFVTGNVERAAELFHEVRERAESDLDRAEILRRWMLLHQGVGRYKEALDLGLEALGLLGVTFPESGEEVLAAFLEEQKAFAEKLGERDIAELDRLPVATDPRARAIMSILAVAGSCAYNARQALTPLIYSKALNAALEWGNTPATCMTYISYGSFLISRGDVDAATAFAELALRLNERFEDLEHRGTLLYVQGAHVNVWRRHLATSLPIHEEGFRVCQDVGDMVFANFNASAVATLVVESGQPLEEVVRETRRYAAFSRESRNEPVRQWIRANGQLAQCLRGATDGPTCLDGGDFSEQQSLEIVTRANFHTGIANLHLTRLQVLVFQQCWEEALAAAERCAETVNALRSGPLEVTYHFFHALVLTALYQQADAERRREIEAALEKKQKLFGFWAKHCPDSYRSRCALVLAEVARLEERHLDAMKLYDEAIRSASEQGFVQVEGLANELASCFYRSLGIDRIAELYRRGARDAYERWGASALVERLDREVARSPASGGGDASVGTRLEHLDLTTVLKASQAVSNEIVLDRLVETLLEIALEDAGADRGLLIRVGNEAPRIVAQATAGNQGVSVELGRHGASSGEVPSTVLGYVQRSHETVLIDDAERENPFAGDRYFERCAPRSVLCVPLLKQSLLVGVLYLENHLAPGVFTEDRTAVLEVLASQAAISLENAELYAELEREQASIRELNVTLEQRVAERTIELDRALAEQREILEQLAERSRDLEEARDRADQASRSKSEFLANMSHEIRTPINAITGFTTLALRTELDERQAGYLGRIQAAAHGLLRIIDDLLDFSKIEAGHLEMEQIPLRLSDVLDGVFGQFEATAEEKGLRFLRRVGADVPPELIGDPYRLGQVLLNLCSNAFKFTEAGEVELRVELDEPVAERARLLFSVRDTGVGLDRDQVDNLFQAFGQADASITRRFGGTGLGLVICQRLVGLMNGRIWLESEPGVGTTFFFVVELGLAQGRSEGQIETSPRAPCVASTEPGRLAGARLLVVEDNPINQEIARELLEHEGAVVRLAEDGQRALELIEREGVGAFDAALVDLQMPEMDGFEATRRIRKMPGGERLPVIALTAHAMREERARCLAAGMQDHVAKPIDPDLMTAKLLRWLKPDPRVTEAEAREISAGPGAEPRLPAELPGVDLTLGLSRCSRNATLYLQLLQRFHEQFHAAPAEIDRLANAGDLAGVRGRAHEVKGVAGNLGMIGLEAAAEALEQAARNDGAATDLEAAQSRFANRLSEIVGGLESFLQASL